MANEPEVLETPAESPVLEMTQKQLEERIDTDPEFADSLLAGKVKVKEAGTPTDDKPPVVAEPAKPADKPTVEPKPVVAAEPKKTWDVKDENGNILVSYPSENELLKAVREKELYIRKLKDERKNLGNETLSYRQQLEQLQAEVAQLKTAQPKPAESKPAPVIQSEKLDPFAPDFNEKLIQRLDGYQAVIEELRNKNKELEDRDQKRETERQREREIETHRKGMQKQFSELNSFIGKTDELKLPVAFEVANDTYAEFLEELGRIAGTDGKVESNVAVMKVYNDETSERGKQLKAEADKIGLKPPEYLNTYFRVVNLLNEQKTLFRNENGKQVPFTIAETHRYLRAMGDGQVPNPTPKPQTETPENKPQTSPRAEALEVAAARKGEAAKDIPTGAGTVTSIDDLTEAQKMEIMDWPLADIVRDPSKRATWEAVFKSLGMEPPVLPKMS